MNEASRTVDEAEEDSAPVCVVIVPMVDVSESTNVGVLMANRPVDLVAVVVVVRAIRLSCFPRFLMDELTPCVTSGLAVRILLAT